MRRKLFLSFSLILTLFLLFQSIFAQETPFAQISPFLGSFCKDLLGITDEKICAWPNFFWTLVLPYIATLAIIYGMFEEIGIFRRAKHTSVLYLIIAISWAMLLIPTGFLGYIAVWLYTIGAFISVAAFMVLFFFGIGLLLWRRPTEMLTEAQQKVLDTYNKEKENLEKLKNDLQRRQNAARTAEERMAYVDEIARVEAKLRGAEAKITAFSREMAIGGGKKVSFAIVLAFIFVIIIMVIVFVLLSRRPPIA